jgi:hypothetical protein
MVTCIIYLELTSSSGYGLVGGISTSDFHVSEYDGVQNHLSMIGANIGAGYAPGHSVILDSSYRTVAEVHTGNGRAPGDLREFKVLPGGKTALQTLDQPYAGDLTTYNLTGGQGWLMDGVFQEIDIASGDVLFEWRASEHVDPADSYLPPTGTAGTSPLVAWDFFHINAVDKDPEGNYLVSARSFCSIFSISGTTGEILWRLDGKTPARSDYTLEDFLFSFQYNIRYHNSSGSVSLYTFLDNGSSGDSALATSNQTYGYLISLNHDSKIAKLVEKYSAPQPGGLLTTSQGNVQVLSSGNVFMGWGSNPYISEYIADGTAVYFARFSSEAGPASYRNYKANFTATPIDRPAVYAYSRNATAPTTVWTSWNGATEVRSWRFWTRRGNETEFKPESEVERSGFETNSTVAAGVESLYTEALDSEGRSLGKSGIEAPFVPGPVLAESCREFQCPLL